MRQHTDDIASGAAGRSSELKSGGSITWKKKSGVESNRARAVVVMRLCDVQNGEVLGRKTDPRSSCAEVLGTAG